MSSSETTVTEAYSLLGLNSKATAAEARKSFHSLALKHHPDKNPGNPGASAKFAAYASAYETVQRNLAAQSDDDDDDDPMLFTFSFGGQHGGRRADLYEDMYEELFRGSFGKNGDGPSLRVPQNDDGSCDCTDCQEWWAQMAAAAAEAEARKRLERERIDAQKAVQAQKELRAREEKTAAEARTSERASRSVDVEGAIQSIREALERMKTASPCARDEEASLLASSLFAAQAVLQFSTRDGANLVSVSMGRDRLNAACKRASEVLRRRAAAAAVTPVPAEDPLPVQSESRPAAQSVEPLSANTSSESAAPHRSLTAGRPVCNFFNASKGCLRINCRFKHEMLPPL